MYRNQKISILIPSFNEREGIRYIMESVPGWVDEVVVVDCSTDGTDDIARQLGARVIRERPTGYGQAYLTGFQHVTGDVIITMDADGTYPVKSEELGGLLDRLIDGKHDFISGSRFPARFSRGIMPRERVLGNRLMTSWANLLFQTSYNDILSGMWILRREVVPKLSVTSANWLLSAEIKLAALTNPEINFAEVHIPYRKRIGESKFARPWYSLYRAGFENALYLLARRIYGLFR